MPLIWEWEKVEADPFDFYRLRVPGGWLVATQEPNYRTEAAGALAFVPDPEHTWKV